LELALILERLLISRERIAPIQRSCTQLSGNLSKNYGNPFLLGIPFLQFSKKRLMDDHARSALACLALLLSALANEKFFVNTAL